MRFRVRVLASLCLLALAGLLRAENPVLTKFCRFQAGEKIAYGVVHGESIVELDGDLFGKWKETDKTHRLDSVKLLAPCRPTQVFAMAGNYKSHLHVTQTVHTITTVTKLTTDKNGETKVDSKTTTDTSKSDEIPKKFQIPQVFLKGPTCITSTGTDIVIPPGTNDVHYEAEMVVVIGKKAKDVSEADALKYVLGVTAGNDVSARDWQKSDVQWWRAKGSDTFGPIGPYIVSGVNYDNLQIQLRLNGKKLQDCNTKEMIHNVAKQVSFISKQVTLMPGDVIFTGTSGTTSAMKPGDVVEVEIESVGILKNNVVGPK
jgi:2-keto-4-pentenoate hydratase/2-oxohepta-3-ene-1,7-dioic acid hydratase in catechol pathway